MILELISWLFCYMAIQFIGDKAASLFSFKDQSNSLVFIFFLGLVTLGLISLWASLIIPLNWIRVLMPLTAFMAIATKANRNRFLQLFNFGFSGEKTVWQGTFILLVLVYLFHSSQPMHLGDTYLYHLQFMKWTQQFSVVPGLSNLNPRFGFNPSSILVSSLLSFEFKLVGTSKTYYFFSVNALTISVLTAHFFKQMKFAYEEANIPRVIYYISLIILIVGLIVPTSLGSLSTDVLPAALTLYLFDLILWKKGYLNRSEMTMVLALVSYCVVCKLSGLMLVFLLIPLLVRNNWKEHWKETIVIGAFFAIPFVLRNYILSGYLLFPLGEIDLFSPDWKVPPSIVGWVGDDVTNWARSQTQDFSFIDVSMADWVPYWFKLKGLLAKVIILAIPISLTVLIVKYVLRKNTFRLQIAIVLLINEVFWFQMAPTLRFAWGIHFVVISLCLYEIASLHKIRRLFNSIRIKAIHFNGALVFFLVFLNIGFTYFTDFYKVQGYKYKSILIMPSPTPDIRYETWGEDRKIYYPYESAHCTNLPLPCAPKFEEKLELRGPNLQDGFRMIE